LAIEPPAGTHRREYDPATAEVVLGAAAALIRAVGFASQHMILIGGLVPGLLVPELDPGVEPHIGTADLDVCLSVALMEGTTGEYEKIQQSLKRAGFQPTDQSWRWRGGTAFPVVVEFFCPQPEGVPPGTVFRPPAARWRARANLGSQLGALTLAAGGLIGQDVEEVEREVVLPGGKGRLKMKLRVTGPAGFLVAKAAALTGRDKPKDAYDIVWLLEAWPGGPAGAAHAMRARRAFNDRDLEGAFATLADQFGDLDRVGSVAYARFVADAGDDLDLLARRAAGAVGEFLRTVRGRE
jgi:hypothetical protein